ncbi:MAG: hypothetical protein Q8R60_17590 [Mycobacteriales bacterium]|nr:hypothetical protein [Mycobacteriales bacterium]
MTARRSRDEPGPAAPVVTVLDGAGRPVGELLAGLPDRPPPTDRGARRLAAVSLALVLAGIAAVPDLRRSAEREAQLADVVEVSASLVSQVGVGEAGGVVLDLGLEVRNTGPRVVRLRDAALTPGFVTSRVEPRLRRTSLPPGGTARVDVRVTPSCASAEGLAALEVDRELGLTAAAASGRERRVAVAVRDVLDRLVRGACRRQPVTESLVLSAGDAALVGGRLSFTMGIARDTLQGGTLVGVEARGLKVSAPVLPLLLPLLGRDEVAEVPVVVEIADCTQLRLNPRGYLLVLGLRVADGAGRRSTVFTGIGDDRTPLNRLGAGLLARGCGFDPLFRTA